VLHHVLVHVAVHEALQRAEAAAGQQLHVARVALAALLAVVARVDQRTRVAPVLHHEVHQPPAMRLDVAAARITVGYDTRQQGERQRVSGTAAAVCAPGDAASNRRTHCVR
jgi:hypothetical protein